MKLKLLAACSLVLAVCLLGRETFLLGNALAWSRPLLALVFALVPVSFALERRGWVALATAAPLVVLVAELALTETAQASPPPVPQPAPTFTALTHNLLFKGARMETSAVMLERSGVDLLAVQELTTAWTERLELPRYPHRALHPLGNGSGFGVYSKYPLRRLQLLGPEGAPFAQCFDVAIPRGPLHVCNVHLSSPAGALAKKSGRLEALAKNARRRAEQWSHVHAYLENQGPAGEPRLVLGDLNTMESEPLYQVVAKEYVDAWREHHEEGGATWPHRVELPPFPVVRIDYLLSRGPLVPLEASVPEASGSDHLAVRAAFAVGR